MTTPACTMTWRPHGGWKKQGNVKRRKAEDDEITYRQCYVWNPYARIHCVFAVAIKPVPGTSIIFYSLAYKQSMLLFPKMDALLIRAMVQHFQQVTGFTLEESTVFTLESLGSFWSSFSQDGE